MLSPPGQYFLVAFIPGLVFDGGRGIIDKIGVLDKYIERGLIKKTVKILGVPKTLGGFF